MSEADAAAGGKKSGINHASKSSETEQMTQQLSSTKSAATTTTRQRRIQSQYHSTNGLWEQPQPRIKAASQREAAYLRSSGLVPTSKSKNIDATATATASTTKSVEGNKKDVDNDDVTRHFARQLGSTDARVRHQTIRQLKAYLKIRSDVKNEGLSEMDMVKLWKCFWYTLYMADRVPVQEELCQQLCSLIWSVAGTAEQDEYIAQSYLDSVNASGFMEDDEDEDDDDDDIDEVENDDDIIMEETESIFDNGDDDESSDRDEIDFEAKQLALLEDDSDDDDDDDDEYENGGAYDEIDIFDDEVDEGDNDEDEPEDDEDDVDPMEVRHCQGAHLAAMFVRAFWRTCVREWGKMDKYRVDKFYTCLRYMLAVMYDYMAMRHWSLGIIQLFNDALHEEVLLQVPNGVRYHIVDCCLEELCKAMNRSSGIPLTEATIIDVLEPYFALAQSGDGDDPLQARVVEQVLIKFLNQYSVYSEGYINRQKKPITTEKLENNDLVFDQVHVGTISQFIFEIAADDGVAKDVYRKSLYDVHKLYERRIREVGAENDVDIGDDNNVEDDFDDDDNGEDFDGVDMNDSIDDSPTKNDKFVNQNESIQVSKESPTVNPANEDSAKLAKRKESSTEVPEVSSTTPVQPKKKKTKKEKKGKKSVAVADETIAPEFKEEVVTISKADQKVAETAMIVSVTNTASIQTYSNANKKRRNDRTAGVIEDAEAQQKRVKFGDNNRARSYSASMENLSKLIVKPMLEKSPDRSIFLKTDNKNTIIAINHNPLPTFQHPQKAKRRQQPQQLQQQQRNNFTGSYPRNNDQFSGNRKLKGRKLAKEYF